MSYRAVAAQDTLDSLFACTAKDRQTLAKSLRTLTLDPFQAGDYEEFDETGRPVQVKLVGASMATFWADHAAREIRVIRVEKIG